MIQLQSGEFFAGWETKTSYLKLVFKKEVVNVDKYIIECTHTLKHICKWPNYEQRLLL